MGCGCVFFSRSAERSELLIESEVRSAESLTDVVLNTRAVQADANLNQGLYIYILMCAQYWTWIIG